MDIMILALSRWDGEYSSTILSLAKVFARNHRVFYIDNPFTIKGIVARFRSRQVRRRLSALILGRNTFSTPISELPDFVAITPMMTLSINWLPKGRIFSFLSYINDRIVFRAVKKTLTKYSINDFVYVNSFNPLYGNNFPETFRPRKTIYHCVDDISKAPNLWKHGRRLEDEAVRRADLVITTSGELARLKSDAAENVHILPNAANVGLFQRAILERLQKPAEIKQIPGERPLITYIGNICHRLDYNLLLSIADGLPQYTLLMVGPFGTSDYRESGLDRRPNVIFTGQKKLEELPAYLQYSHCCIIPFLCNTLTKSIYPLKINEYLSAGKPVVTTPFSEDIQSFSGVIHITGEQDEFVSAIKEVILTDNEEQQRKRVDFSTENSWENRANEFWKIVNDVNHEERLHTVPG